MQIHVVVGPPCSGKSTLVEERRADHDIRLDYDALAEALGCRVPHDPPPGITSAAFAARKAVESRVLEKRGFDDDPDVWVIRSILTDETAQRYADAGAKFYLVDPGKEECLRRAESDKRPQRSFDVIETWYKEPPVLPDGVDWVEIISPAKAATVQTKDFTVEKSDGCKHSFTGYASVFDNIDSHGHVMRKGAFAESIAKFGENGANIPCFWVHQVTDPRMCIGKTISAIEDDHGLKVEVELYTTQGGDSPADAAYRLLKDGVVKEMSFQFRIREGAWNEDIEAFEITKVDIGEVSVVTLGANSDTEIIEVKACCDVGEKTSPLGNSGGGAGIDGPAEKAVVEDLDEDPAGKSRQDQAGKTPPSDSVTILALAAMARAGSM